MIEEKKNGKIYEHRNNNFLNGLECSFAQHEKYMSQRFLIQNKANKSKPLSWFKAKPPASCILLTAKIIYGIK